MLATGIAVVALLGTAAALILSIHARALARDGERRSAELSNALTALEGRLAADHAAFENRVEGLEQSLQQTQRDLAEARGATATPLPVPPRSTKSSLDELRQRLRAEQQNAAETDEDA